MNFIKSKIMRLSDVAFIKSSLIIMVLACALSCGVTKDREKSTDQAKLQGTWMGQSESQNGITKDVSFLYIFEGDNITFIDETGKEMKYSFKLDNTSRPKMIVIQSKDTLTTSAPVSVAYELDGNSLKLVVAPAGLRPTEISDKNNQELIFCKRKGS